ncbi:hypothetical protein [Peribacillus sp. NPDC096448]|uniref:hypothetical protein n=1 Tax=Peribacillus sp. NPDC096448 TaxID=3364395 RepID=UPI003805967E
MHTRWHKGRKSSDHCSVRTVLIVTNYAPTSDVDIAKRFIFIILNGKTGKQAVPMAVACFFYMVMPKYPN